jgi:hypothetical protein
VHRLRETIERSLGALLVARRVRNTRNCSELAAILDGWDGHFNVLMRKRISRHIDSCDVCEQERRRLASPVALLGAAPVLVPAPAWLRERTLREIALTSAGSALPVDHDPVDHDAKATGEQNTHGYLLPIALFVGALAGVAALMFVWLNQQSVPTPTEVSTTVTAPVPPPPPSAAAPPPPVSVTTTPVPVAPQPSPRVQPVAPTVPPTASSSEPPPPPVVEPSVVAPPPPPPPPLPDWPDWLPEWPDPPPPPPGGDLTGPGDLVAPGGGSTPGGLPVP